MEINRINKGDSVAVIAPSGFVDPEKLEEGIKALKSWELNVIEGKHLNKRSGYFSASDEERLADVQEAFDNPDIRAVFCARGGYGISRIIDRIDFSKMVENPKPLIGFSDISLLHFGLQKHGIPAIHGPMVAQFSKEEYRKSVELLRELLFTGEVSYYVHADGTFPRKGKISGGNLRMIIDSLSTDHEIDTENKVLLIEDIGEGLYKIDRMMQHLRRAGKLRNLAGVMMGHFSDLSDSIPAFEKNVEEIIREAIGDESIPTISDFPVGHEPPNFPVVIGGEYQLSEDGSGWKIIHSYNPATVR